MDHNLLFSATAVALDPSKRTIFLIAPLNSINTREDNERLALIYCEEIRALRPECNVINPAELIKIEGWSHTDYIQFWKAFMSKFVDIVIMAPEWKSSAGCIMEHTHAEQRDLEIFEYTDLVT